MKKFAFIKNRRLTGEAWLLLVMLAFVLFNINTFTTWFRSDSEIYYQGICNSVENLKNGEISLANFGIAGHMCYGYSIFVFIGQLLLPQFGIGIRLANLLLALVTIGLFWGALGNLFPKLDQWTKLFVTAAFAFSPFLLGIFSEVHSDFPVLCFFVWMVYFYTSGMQIATLVTGFLLCFSKETGVLYFGTFFAGCFLYRLINNANKNWLKKLYDEFSIKEWMLLIPADLFLIRAFFSAGWGGSAIAPRLTDGRVNSFVISGDYILLKLREIFLMNFAWLLVLPVAIFTVALFKKKLLKVETKAEWMTGIGVSAVAFFLFNFSYYTFTHYRYLQLYLFFFLAGVVLLLEASCDRLWLKRTVCLLFAAAFLAESFLTVDPVTKLAFRQVDVGNGTIVTTNEYTTNQVDGATFVSASEGGDIERGELLDSMVYNREYLGFERVFEEAMADIAYDSSKVLIFPGAYDGDVVFTMLAYLGTHDPTKLRWDTKTGNMALGWGDEQTRWIDITQGGFEVLAEYPEVWYVKLYYHGEWYREKNLEHFTVLEERHYQSGKWKLAFERVEYQK